jgi:hypothetical protein
VPQIKQPNVPSAMVSETADVLLRFLSNIAGVHLEWGHFKMNQHDRELLDKQMRRLGPPRQDGAIAVMLAAMFLIGITVGGLLSTHQSESTQIETMGTRG